MSDAHREAVLAEFAGQSSTFAGAAHPPAALARLMQVAAPGAGERWLDVACGPGVVSRALAPFAGSVHGTDVTPAMVETARAGAPPNCSFAEGDATATGFDDGSFDGAITRFSLHHIPRPGRVVAELGRVVAPGGSVVVCDHVADDDRAAFAWSQEIERLRDPSHWATLTVDELRSLGTGLELEEEVVVPFVIDYDQWRRRGSGGDAARTLIDAAVSAPPPGAACFRRDGGSLALRVWMGRWRRPSAAASPSSH